MDNDLKKVQLQKFAIDLLDRADDISMRETEWEVSNLLKRVSNIGSIADLNYESLNEKDIDLVLKMMTLYENSTIDEIVCNDLLHNLVESIEVLFREKKMLLDKKIEKVAA